jgi:[ribosomal protein S5]-alanine N-acetyltransferase
MTSVVMIETARLILRTLTKADIHDVASSWKLDEGPIPLSEAEKKIERMLSYHAQNVTGKLVHLCLAIIAKETYEFIGWCGLDHTVQEDADPALFYLLKKKCWGKGLATEAASALLDYALTQLGLASIHGGAAYDNLASKRVMEKIGMRYVGLAEDGGCAFEITRDEHMSTINKEKSLNMPVPKRCGEMMEEI